MNIKIKLVTSWLRGVGYCGYVWCVSSILYLNKTRAFSTNSNNLSPAIVYADAGTHKELVLKDNRGKAGVYRLVNKENGKTYVGSAVNLSKRFARYYNIKQISKDNMSINKALLKYGYPGFQLEILEYCDPKDTIKREQYYIDLLVPEYNRFFIKKNYIIYYIYNMIKNCWFKFRLQTY